MKLSPKAQLFVRRAVEEAASDPLKISARRLGADAWSGELSAEAGRIAIAALDDCRKQLRLRLEGSLTDGEAAELSNDLGFIEAVCSDLARALESS